MVSSRDPEASRTVLLDACCILNLCAGGILEQFLQAVPGTWGAAGYVLRNEVLSVYEPIDDKGTLGKVPIDLGILVDSGLLTAHAIADETEAELVLRFVGEGLDDGEAHTSAMAATRNWMVATDEKRALNLLAEAGVSTCGTIELVRLFCEQAHLAEDGIFELVHLIERRGRFLSPKRDPHREWWESHRTTNSDLGGGITAQAPLAHGEP